MCLTTSQDPSCWHPSWLSNVCSTRKDLESEWLAKDSPETIPITIKPTTASHKTEQFSWVPFPSCSLPRRSFPIKSLALPAHVSSDNSFPSVRQEPTLGSLGGVLLPTTFLPGESQGQRSLAGYSPQGHKEVDMSEATWHAHTLGHQKGELSPLRTTAEPNKKTSFSCWQELS